jgi:uncharacterized protein
VNTIEKPIPRLQRHPLTRLPVVPQLQIAMDCNLNCAYCYEQHTNRTMDLMTVEAILRNTVEHNRCLTPAAPVLVYWHGGEPLLAGIDFFRSVVRWQATMRDVFFENRVQTNGTLMTDELAGLFHEYNFAVGFSIDGPQDLHDRHRRFRHSSKGTFSAAMKGLERYLKRNPSSRPAVIAVVTTNSIDRVDDIYHFFNSLGARVQLDIFDLRVRDFLQGGPFTDAGESLCPTSDAVARFLIRLFDLWFNDPNGHADFAELRHEVKMALRPERDFGDPYHKKRCDFRRLIFSPNGDAFCCDQYINDARTTLGNIFTDSLAEITTRKMDLWEAVKAHFRGTDRSMACYDCPWGRQCAGGCLTCMKYNWALQTARSKGWSDNRWQEVQLPSEIRDLRGETYYCEGLRTFRDHVKRAVEAALAPA